MSDLEYKIKVMQHFADNGKIELKKKDNPSNGWEEIKYPNWNWAHFDYRIKEEPKKTKEVFEWMHIYNGKWWIETRLMTKDEAKEFFIDITYKKTGRSFIVECE